MATIDPLQSPIDPLQSPIYRGPNRTAGGGGPWLPIAQRGNGAPWSSRPPQSALGYQMQAGAGGGGPWLPIVQRGGGAPPPQGQAPDFRLQILQSQYGPQLGQTIYNETLRRASQPGVSAQPGAAPVPWNNRPNWTFQPGGAGPFANLDPADWENQANQLGVSLPWAQLAQNGQLAQWQQGLASSQFGADQVQAAWARAMAERNAGAGDQQRGFENWLAQQQLSLQQQASERAGGQQQIDNSWRQRQLDLQAEAQAAQLGLTREQFNAARQDAQWGQNFQQQDWNRSGDQWNQQFGANRADTQWGQNFQQQQADRANDQWGQQFGANRADTQWGQNFQQQQANRSADQWERQFGVGIDQWQRQFGASEDQRGQDNAYRGQQTAEDTRRWDIGNAFNNAQFDWAKQQGAEQNRLQEQGQFLGAFGRKFAPAWGSL